MNKNKNKKIYIIGNVASGKTTLTYKEKVEEYKEKISNLIEE